MLKAIAWVPAVYLLLVMARASSGRLQSRAFSVLAGLTAIGGALWSRQSGYWWVAVVLMAMAVAAVFVYLGAGLLSPVVVTSAELERAVLSRLKRRTAVVTMTVRPFDGLVGACGYIRKRSYWLDSCPHCWLERFVTRNVIGDIGSVLGAYRHNFYYGQASTVGFFGPVSRVSADCRTASSAALRPKLSNPRPFVSATCPYHGSLVLSSTKEDWEKELAAETSRAVISSNDDQPNPPAEA